MKRSRYIVIDKDNNNEVIARVDLTNSTEYNSSEWDRYIVENLDNQENILILFEEDIDYDFDRLHQYLKVNLDGSVEDTRSERYTYTFFKEKVLFDSKKTIVLDTKVMRFDSELTDKDIEDLIVALNMTRVEYKHGKYPSDATIFKIEGKLDLIKGK